LLNNNTLTKIMKVAISYLIYLVVSSLKFFMLLFVTRIQLIIFSLMTFFLFDKVKKILKKN